MTPLVAIPNGGVSSYTQIRICIKIESGVRADKEISRSNISIQLLYSELTWDRGVMHHSIDAQVDPGPGAGKENKSSSTSTLVCGMGRPSFL
jgi:hypothetical protein